MGTARGGREDFPGTALGTRLATATSTRPIHAYPRSTSRQSLHSCAFAHTGRVLVCAPARGETAKLAASIRADEQRMLARVLREIAKLTDAVVRAEVNGHPSYDARTTGAADALREAGEGARSKTTKTAASAKRTARQARKVPGVARAEGQIKGAVASQQDLAIARYDTLTAEQITAKLPDLSQIDLAKIETHERNNHNRTTILGRVTSLRSDEPWAGYDELTAAEVTAALSEGDDKRRTDVRSYEPTHKNRAGVLKATQREPTNA